MTGSLERLDAMTNQEALKQLNRAFTAFKVAEARLVLAESERNSDQAILAWHAKNQASQSYMEAWDILMKGGEVHFDERSGEFIFIPT